MSDLTDELSASCMCLEDSSVAGTLIRCSYCKALARIEALEALFVDEEELRSRIRALEAADKEAAIYFQRAMKERDARIAALEAAGKRLAEAVESESTTKVIASALDAWRAAEKGGGDE